MNLTEQLHDYVRAAFAGLWVQTTEPDEAEREILKHAEQNHWKIAVWDVAYGLRRPCTKTAQADAGPGDPLAALRALPALGAKDGTALLLLHNFHRFLGNPEVIQAAFTQLVEGTRSINRQKVLR